MSPKTLRDGLREHYDSQQLRAGTRERLLKLTETVEEPRSHHRRTAFVFAAAAAAILVLVASGLLVRPWLDREAATDGRPALRLAHGVAAEIAMNHSKDLAVEFAGDSFAELSRSMDRLDFALVAPSRLGDRDLQLIGARYCSIQGSLAAQLRLRDAAGRVYTLYQTASAGELASLDDSRLAVSGWMVEIWREQGLLMGLAGDS